MIFNVFKTEIKLSFLFVSLLVVAAITLDEKVVLLSFIASFIHECGHLFFMCLFHSTPYKIEFAIFGIRIERNNCVDLSYKKEAIIAAGGIIFNLLFSFLLFIFYKLLEFNDFLLFATINIFVAAVNSLPVSALDCGRAMKYLCLLKFEDEKTEKITSFISYVFVSVFTVFVAVYIKCYGINVSIIAVNIYLIFVTIIKKWS